LESKQSKQEPQITRLSRHYPEVFHKVIHRFRGELKNPLKIISLRRIPQLRLSFGCQLARSFFSSVRNGEVSVRIPYLGNAVKSLIFIASKTLNFPSP
jgi:hypothetical protein